MEGLIIVLVLILAFFIWRWLIGRWFKRSMSKNIAAAVAAIFITPMLCFLLMLFVALAIFGLPKPHDYDKKFDKNEWVNNSYRYQMLKNIIDSKMLIGKSKKEMRQMLGKEEQ